MSGGDQPGTTSGVRYVGVGLVLAAIFWVAEAAIHYYFIERDAFLPHVFEPTAHEMWMRLLVGGLLIVLGLYAQHGVNALRRSEQALAASERRYRTLIEEALNPVFVVDEAGRFVEFNQAALGFFERDPLELRSTTCREVLGFEPREAGADGSPLELGDAELDVRVGSTTRTLLLNVVPLSAGASPLFVGIGQDITERKQAEKNLELAHADLNQIFSTASSAMRVIDRNSRVVKINRPFAELTGISEQQAIGATCSDVFGGDHCDTPECPLVRILGGEHEIEYEIKKTRKDGASIHCLLTARPFLDSDGTPVGIVESFKDITELGRVQEELRTERDRLRHILFQRFEGVGILRQDHTIEYQNRTLTDEIGEHVGSACYRALRGRDEPCEPCAMEEAVRTGKLQQCEMDIPGGRTFEHTYTTFRDATDDAKVLVLIRDISDRKASRAAVIRSEQLAALGELAAGVAHEINNPINGIINYAELLQSGRRGADHVASIAERIAAEGDRVAHIVASLLSFARRESTMRVPTNIGPLLEDTLTLLRAQLRKDSIQLDVVIDNDLPRVSCVPQEIQQVLMNIVSNARYALNQRFPGPDPGKRLEIRAVRRSTTVGDEVEVTVRDHGIGISADNLSKVTNPFFSTKPKGEGTGLGLSISHETVRQHGGRFVIDSREGEYTRVTVVLPELTPTSAGVGDPLDGASAGTGTAAGSGA